MKNLINANPVFARAAISWASAQIIKAFINFIITKEFSLERLFGSGGMPSSHSAFVTALAVSTVRVCGYSSVDSALAIALAIVVMYDAMNVRRQAGEQAKIINALVEGLQEMKLIDEEMKHNLKIFLGHTPLQVFFGALLGFVIALIMN